MPFVDTVFPVAEPTINTGFPTPYEVAETVSPTFTIPADMAFTRGLMRCNIRQKYFATTVGIPKAFP